jgi:uncharacterized LabA/DUF88 family protein
MRRVAVFVFEANMFYTQRHLCWHIDFKRLLHCLVEGKTLHNAFYYTGVNPDRPVDEGFYRFLANAGFAVRREPLKHITDPAAGATIKKKANLDVEMVQDMGTTPPWYDEAVPCTGDSGFEPAVMHLRSRGKTVVVLSNPGVVSVELRNVADAFINLAGWWTALERPATERRPTQPGAAAAVPILQATEEQADRQRVGRPDR